MIKTGEARAAAASVITAMHQPWRDAARQAATLRRWRRDAVTRVRPLLHSLRARPAPLCGGWQGVFGTQPLRRRLLASIGSVGGATSCAAVACGVAVVPAAHAGFGAYTPGLGAQSTGAAGIAYSLVQDSTTLSANPALARQLGARLDLTLEYDGAYSTFSINGNLLGPNRKYRSRARHFGVPQAGFTMALSDDWSFGMTGFVAGLGSDYKDSPFRRFGGDERASLMLNQVGVSTALAWEPVATQSFGLALNLSYDAIEVSGVQSLALFSESPQRFSDRGMDGAPGIGFTLGWYGRLAPWLAAGAGYRSKTYALARIEQYEGLLPEQGTLEFPAVYGAGIAVEPRAGWTFALEFQRAEYSDEITFSSPLSQIREHRFGSDQGPGFGWVSQNIARLAVTWAPNPAWLLRAGYGRGSAQIPRSETLLSAFAPNTGTAHYTAGATWTRDSGWAYTLAAGYAPKVRLRGRDSIPAIAGGGEADIELESPFFVLSASRAFDWQWRDD